MLELGKFIAMLILVAGINLFFKDAAARRHYKNSIQALGYDSAFLERQRLVENYER
jgi:hypothetical protein